MGLLGFSSPLVVVVFYLVLNAASLVNGGKTSSFFRKVEKTMDMAVFLFPVHSTLKMWVEKIRKKSPCLDSARHIPGPHRKNPGTVRVRVAMCDMQVGPGQPQTRTRPALLPSLFVA